MDLVISLVASVLVAVVAFLFGVSDVDNRVMNIVWGLSSVAASGLMFYVLKTYEVVIRHFTFKDTMLFALASFGKVFIVGCVLAVSGLLSFSATMLLCMDFLVTLTALCTVRLLMIVVYDWYMAKVREAKKRMRVLVYGIGDKSIAMLTRLRGSKHYDVAGFLSRDRELENTRFADSPVYVAGSCEKFESLVNTMCIGGVIFSTEDSLYSEKDGIVDFAGKNGIKLLIAPSIDEFSEKPNLGVREVKIEDLLGREEIKISMDTIIANFRDKVIMVTGAAGSIGSELCRQLATFGIKKLILYDNAETPMHNLRIELENEFPQLDFVPIIGDVRLVNRLNFAFSTYRPQVVFHAAAYKHVPLMEENPCEAVLANVAGSRNVADKCIEYGVEKMVMISTDKAVNPTNIMGCTKRLAEIYVQSLGLAIERREVEGRTRFVTTRFGNVLGSNGSVIPRFREQIAKGGPVTVTDKNIVRFFMTIPEACRLVMEAATLPIENRICVFDMGQPVKIDSLARRMVELSGLVPDVDIKIEYTGLRPGEKLYEEVLSDVENTEPTSHDKIRVARVMEYDYGEAKKYVEELEALSRNVEIPDMVKLMKKIVPEYVSNNSRFHEYDKPQSADA